MSDLGTPADWGDSETGLWSSNNPLAPRLITLRRERDDALAECERLRAALAAYRSALRSGEPETDQLRAFGDAALARAPLGETDN